MELSFFLGFHPLVGLKKERKKEIFTNDFELELGLT